MQPEPVHPLKIAILAMGGEGGGVLADWIVSAAEHEGFYAQSTSVPGVAQRTGATIYYAEILPVRRTPGLDPVLGLMPTPGDVDVVLGSELMEAARAVQRGLVTSDRTLLITSSHRVYALPEKMAMGDGRQNYESLKASCLQAAHAFVARDFSALAERNGSVISASLFGALTASGVLPWSRAASEAAIERGGVGVAASLKAFDAGLRAYHEDEPAAFGTQSAGCGALDPRLDALGTRIEREFPASVRGVLRVGVTRAADYQDPAYAARYLDRLVPIRMVDPQGGRLLAETARYLALWMSYEDTVRVAELKLRATRFERVRKEAGGNDEQVLHINEFFHPRLEEIADTLPAGLGRWLLRTGWARRLVRRATARGRVVRTTTVRGCLLLYGVYLFKGVRPRSLRQQRESAEIDQWLAQIARLGPDHYDLACELAECQNLVKGYGDTHARGMRSYRAIVDALPSLRGRPGAAVVLRGLREAAMADESGKTLAEALEQAQCKEAA